MNYHVIEQYHTWASGETGVTVVDRQIVERLVVLQDGSRRWVRESEIDPAQHTLFVAPKPEYDENPEKLTSQSMFRPRANRVLVEIPTSQIVAAEVRPGETRMMTLLPSPVLEPGAEPLTVPYDDAVLAWRHHRWPDCRMTDLPDPTPDPRLSELEAANEALRVRIAELEAARMPALDEKLSSYGNVDADPEITPDDLIDAMRRDQEATQEVVGMLSREKRRKFTELLNVELAELQQLHGAAGENLQREGDIEALLGLFARVGEM